MIMSAYALLQENHEPSEDEIKDGIEGNLCRCTGYVKIFEAVRSVAALCKDFRERARGE